MQTEHVPETSIHQWKGDHGTFRPKWNEQRNEHGPINHITGKPACQGVPCNPYAHLPPFENHQPKACLKNPELTPKPPKPFPMAPKREALVGAVGAAVLRERVQKGLGSAFVRLHKVLVPRRPKMLPKISRNSAEGNFGGNQLDASIRLSPLFPDMTNDLHVSTATSLHQSFHWNIPMKRSQDPACPRIVLLPGITPYANYRS